MISTRDFLLYLVALLFVLYGIGGTLFYDSWHVASTKSEPVPFTNEEVLLGAVITTAVDTRSENINRLRSKLASGAGEAPAGPPVFTSVDETITSSSSQAGGELFLCSGYQAAGKDLVAWPATGVVDTVIEGARVYRDLNSEGSVLLQLPASPVAMASPNCLPSSVVGVTLSGQLIDNQATSLVRAESAVLIGYALDGFPIYTKPEALVALDECGGTSAFGDYRYLVGADQDFLLACFKGIPASF